MTRNHLILSEALQAVGAQAETLKLGGPLQVVFYHWLLAIEMEVDRQAALAGDLQTDISGSGRSIQSVSALGFLLAHSPSLVDVHRAVFQQGIEWLMGRTGGSQAGFAALLQPVAQLGLLAGLLTISDGKLFVKFSKWFGTLLQRANAVSSTTADWRHDLLKQVEIRLKAGLSGDAKVELGSASAAVFVCRGFASLGTAEVDAFAPELLGRLKSLKYSDPEQAALDLVAYGYLARGDIDVDLRAPSLDDVALILQRVPAALRRWTWEEQKRTTNSTAQKWAIENEYHFQNLLYAVLTPVFHDLRDEEWLASVGQKKPRADLVISSLHLVVEVKYWRKNHPPQDLISQISEDVGLYLKKGSPYRHVLPIVWDRGRRTEHYDYLKSGLSEIRDVISPILIPQPAFMR